MGTQTIVAFALGLLVGGAGGAYATRLVYGDAETTVDLDRPTADVTLRCPECPACPPPVDCGELGVVPDVAPADPILPDDSPASSSTLPGLPPLALQRASEAVRRAVAPCIAQAANLDAHGVVLLDLTITATGGQGFVRSVLSAGQSGNPGELEPCIAERARSARFTWEGNDGSQRLKLPIQVLQ